MLSDEQGQSGFPRALIDAVIPKDIPTQALVHFLEIVWLGQPLFLNCHERWAGGSKGNYKSKPYHTAPSVEIDLRRWSNLPEDTPAEFAVQCASPAGNGSDKPPLAKASSDEDPIGLSDRETEIIQCLRQGASNKIIARQLQISEATVKVHIKSLLKKLRVRNRTQAAIWATEARLSEPPQCALSALHQSPEKVLPVSTAHDR
jgi:DNA-binding NarL/FixJ family response regulator